MTSPTETKPEPITRYIVMPLQASKPLGPYGVFALNWQTRECVLVEEVGTHHATARRAVAWNNSTTETARPIQIGDHVRSFDFAQGEHGRDLEGERACYVEGVVYEMREAGHEGRGHAAYEIRATKDVFGGVVSTEREHHSRVGLVIFAPVNGTPRSIGGVCDSVELLEATS